MSILGDKIRDKIQPEYDLDSTWDADEQISVDEAYSSGMRRAATIADGYMVTFGWTPVTRRHPKTDTNWYMVRDTPDGLPYAATCCQGTWVDAGGDQYKECRPTEYYRLPKE